MVNARLLAGVTKMEQARRARTLHKPMLWKREDNIDEGSQNMKNRKSAEEIRWEAKNKMAKLGMVKTCQDCGHEIRMPYKKCQRCKLKRDKEDAKELLLIADYDRINEQLGDLPDSWS